MTLISIGLNLVAKHLIEMKHENLSEPIPCEFVLVAEPIGSKMAESLLISNK